MEVVRQTLDEILAALQPVAVDWQDETATRVIADLEAMDIKPAYTKADVERFLDKNFDEGLLICRLFLGLSADQLRGTLTGIGSVTAYRKDKTPLLGKLIDDLGLLDAMGQYVNRAPKWSDILVERLRAGRGSAISGQKRGRGVEDTIETIVKEVFGDSYDSRCNFTGKTGEIAKCDFAIPSKTDPRILLECKAYGATGSKMTDVIGDIVKIINTKRSDTVLFLLTDGVTWNQRKADMNKLVAYQNKGDITRIYTLSMAEQLKADLQQLKLELKL